MLGNPAHDLGRCPGKNISNVCDRYRPESNPIKVRQWFQSVHAKAGYPFHNAPCSFKGGCYFIGATRNSKRVIADPNLGHAVRTSSRSFASSSRE